MESLERPRVEYRTPEDLARDVQRGRIRIPPFQRSFKWEAADVVRLFDSLLRGFPIGNLLLWQRPAPAQRLQVGPLVIDAAETESALWVVDGQQRIVSLVGALTLAAKASDPRFRVHLDLDTGDFHTAGMRQQPPTSWVPVSYLLDTATLLRWMRQNADWLTNAQLDLADAAAKAIREYQIPTYVVSSEREDPLLEIFTRMNTTGKRLTKSEVFQALHSGLAGDEPTNLHGLGNLSADLGFGRLDDRLALRCVLAFRGGDIFREDFADEFSSDEDQAQTFRDVASALREVISFLRGPAGIPHVRLLPYSHVIPTLVRFVALHGVPVGRTETLLRRWVWRGAVAGTRARGISVPDIRQQLNSVSDASPIEAAGRLLAEIKPYPDFAPELDKIHFSHAVSKLNVLGLLSAEPRDLLSGEPLDITALLSDGSPLRSIVPGSGTALAGTIANRVVLAEGSAAARLDALATASERVAASHVVDPEGQSLLAGAHYEAFLSLRAKQVTVVISDLVSRMAEWGARDGPSMSDLMRTVA
jgi:hypothetical protein